MLFDLRGRGRRRTVQVIYAFLAILMGGGLILFGIGGATSGGLVDAITGKSGNGASSSVYAKRITTYRQQTLTNPSNAQAWVLLTRAQVQDAAVTGYDTASGLYTKDGLAKLQRGAASWERYLALNPAKPDGQVAALMVNAYSAGALNDPTNAARALEIVIDSRGGSAALYSQLAVLRYQAGDSRRSTLAEQRALELSPPAERKLVTARLAAQRKQIDQANLQATANQAQSGAASGTTGP